MPPTKTNAQPAVDLFKKLGQRLIDAHNAHAGDAVEYGNAGDLPPGITGGVARLVDCRIGTIADGKKNAGEPYFYAAGVCVTPVEFDGLRTEGLRTSIMEVLCDTPDRDRRKTTDEHVQWMYNELRKLGVDTRQVDPRNLNATLRALKDAAPYFRFRTWIGQKTDQYPDPRTNHDWGGFIPDYEPPAGDGVADSTGGMSPAAAPVSRNGSASATAPRASAAPAVLANRTVAPAAPAPAARAPARPAARAAPAPPPEPEEPAGGSGEVPFDADAAVEAAGGPDGDPAVEEARAALTAAAEAAGVTDDEINALPNWRAVADLTAERRGGGAAGPAADEALEPVAGDIGKYSPPDPKNTKKRQKAHEVEVTAVNQTRRTVTVKSLDDPKAGPWAGVPWAEFVTE